MAARFKGEDPAHGGGEAMKLWDGRGQMLEKLGATGEFPDGKLSKEDEGELKIALSVESGRLVVRFGKEVGWLGFDKATAVAFGTAIIERARELP